MKKGTGACQFPGCGEPVPEKIYYKRYRICALHYSLPAVVLAGRTLRWCQQCGKFQTIEEFDGEKRSCRRTLDLHNARRRRQGPDAAAREPAADAPPARKTARSTAKAPPPPPPPQQQQGEAKAGDSPFSGCCQPALAPAPPAEATLPAGGELASQSVQGAGGAKLGSAPLEAAASLLPDMSRWGSRESEQCAFSLLPGLQDPPGGPGIWSPWDLAAGEGLEKEGEESASAFALGGWGAGATPGVPSMVLDQIMQDADLQELLGWAPAPGEAPALPAAPAAMAGPALGELLAGVEHAGAAAAPWLEASPLPPLGALRMDATAPPNTAASVFAAHDLASAAAAQPLVLLPAAAAPPHGPGGGVGLLPTAAPAPAPVHSVNLQRGAVVVPRSPLDFQEHTVRLSIKLFDIHPDQLPEQLRQEVMGLVALDPVFVDSFVRPGCTALTVEALAGSDDYHELLQRGAEGVARHLLQRGQGQQWAGNLMVQLDNKVAVVRQGRLAAVVDASPLAPRLVAARPVAILAAAAAGPEPGQQGQAAAAAGGASGPDDGAVTLWGHGISAPQDLVLCRQGGRVLDLEILARGHLPPNLVRPGAPTPEWVVVRPLGARVGLLQFEVQRGGVLSAPASALALPSRTAVAEAQQAQRALAASPHSATFLRDLGWVLSQRTLRQEWRRQEPGEAGASASGSSSAGAGTGAAGSGHAQSLSLGLRLLAQDHGWHALAELLAPTVEQAPAPACWPALGMLSPVREMDSWDTPLSSQKAADEEELSAALTAEPSGDCAAAAAAAAACEGAGGEPCPSSAGPSSPREAACGRALAQGRQQEGALGKEQGDGGEEEDTEEEGGWFDREAEEAAAGVAASRCLMESLLEEDARDWLKQGTAAMSQLEKLGGGLPAWLALQLAGSGREDGLRPRGAGSLMLATVLAAAGLALGMRVSLGAV